VNNTGTETGLLNTPYSAKAPEGKPVLFFFSPGHTPATVRLVRDLPSLLRRTTYLPAKKR
jgi:hypothetical protein